MTGISPQLAVDLNGRKVVWRFREEYQLRGYALILKRKHISYREQWALLPDTTRFTHSRDIKDDLEVGAADV